MIPIYRTSEDLMRKIALSSTTFSLRKRLPQRIRSLKGHAVIRGRPLLLSARSETEPFLESRAIPLWRSVGFLLKKIAREWVSARKREEKSAAVKASMHRRQYRRIADNNRHRFPFNTRKGKFAGWEDTKMRRARMRNPLIAFLFYAHLRVIERELNTKSLVSRVTLARF